MGRPLRKIYGVGGIISAIRGYARPVRKLWETTRYKGRSLIKIIKPENGIVIIVVIMVNVAIAGGNGAVGRTFVEIMALQTKHKAFVLTRKVRRTSHHITSYHLLESILTSLQGPYAI